ncbi:ribonuclease J [Mesoplasma entomophilum]|uniref:RNase J family beta-CASP ribonuclease n=1 Tax=Mesoplasma entomophilum TaxID=2149 RepID=A0A3S5XYM4_9MOLU|nr:ribonuclease J [Mesoplasma entomophilum]ATQ35255.1 RNase J family beta-CASP ribonuclease [Mesoplasma entomophilum]ATZ19203.1 ribonuclease J [Mesoplasma entomophilum]
MSKIKFMALGGQDERGKNLFVLDIDDNLFILDAGVKYPDKGILGVDIVTPKLDYLKNNKQKIKGIFLTNSASYNMGSVPYILKTMDIPVYCNEITQLVGKIKISRMRIKNTKDQNFVVVKDKQILDFGKVKVEVFRTTSASPQSYGYAFHTEEGTIVYAGDYIIDGKEQSYFSTDFNHINEIGKKGVLALIADSEYASRSGFTVPNHKIENFISTSFKEKKTKIAIGIFEEDIFKLGEICMAAKENNRKIAVYGRTMTEILKSNLINENLQILPEDIITVDEYMKSENGLLIISGTGDVLYSKLAKIATGNDEVVEFAEKDLIILATPPAPGVEKRHAQILDELARTDARLIALSDRNIWSMHASYEDIKVFTSMLNPKYFIPVKALFKDSLKAEKAAIEAGVNERNVVILDNGQVANISKNSISIADKKVDIGNSYVDQAGVGDVGAIVLNERKLLATDGVMIIGATIDSRNKELISMIDTQMRGVLYIKEENPIFRIIQKEIESLLEQGQSQFKENPNKYDINEIKKDIATRVRTLIKQESGKQPIVLVIVNEYDGKDYVFKPRNNLNRNNYRNNNNNSKKGSK